MCLSASVLEARRRSRAFFITFHPVSIFLSFLIHVTTSIPYNAGPSANLTQTYWVTPQNQGWCTGPLPADQFSGMTFKSQRQEWSGALTHRADQGQMACPFSRCLLSTAPLSFTKWCGFFPKTGCKLVLSSLVKSYEGCVIPHQPTSPEPHWQVCQDTLDLMLYRETPFPVAGAGVLGIKAPLSRTTPTPGL